MTQPLAHANTFLISVTRCSVVIDMATMLAGGEFTD